nr:restriction endonuclease subunit S [uncultured Prevotella sp.]
MRKEWKLKKIGECFSYIKNGANIKQTKGAGGYPITRIETLSGGVFNRDRLGYADVVDLEQYKEHILESGDLLVSHINSKTYIGRTVVYEGKQGENIIHGMNLLRLKHNRSLINSAFLCYYTQSVSFKLDIMRIRKDAVNQSSFAISDFKKIRIPVPVLATQLSIVSELDKINELIQIKKEQLKDYDALAQSIFYEMFGDPVENEKGWEVKELIETVSPECKISYGIVQPGEHVEDGVSIVRPVDMVSTFISKDGLKKTTKEISNSYSRTILSGKELLVCVRGTTGVVSLVDESLQGANVTRGIAPLLFSENVERWFMYYQVKSSSVRGVISSLTRGIALKQINMSDLRKIRLILPPLSLQQSFAHKIEQIERQKAAVQSTITDLETLLAARMQYWFD